jgi:hypothetical protein
MLLYYIQSINKRASSQLGGCRSWLSTCSLMGGRCECGLLVFFRSVFCDMPGVLWFLSKIFLFC